MPSQRGGGSFGQSLRYVDTLAPERSGPAGQNLLVERGLIARPVIGGSRKVRGGFYPSVMSGVVSGGVVLAPMAAFAARKLLTRKNRHGGAGKTEIRIAQKEEAKKNLMAYGKPSAKNINKYALAKRQGPNRAQIFLENYRKRKQEEAEAAQAKDAVVDRKGAAKAAKALAKAERAATRNAKKAAKALAKAERATTRNAKKAAKTLANAAKAATRKAKQEVKTLANAAKAATMKAKQEAKTLATAAKAAKPKTVKAAKPKTVKAANAANASQTRKKGHSAASQAYFNSLKNARTFLSEHGFPTGANMSKFASMKSKGENTSAWLENFKTRRPKSLATGKKAAKKPLSTVTENNV